VVLVKFGEVQVGGSAFSVVKWLSGIEEEKGLRRGVCEQRNDRGKKNGNGGHRRLLKRRAALCTEEGGMGECSMIEAVVLPR
jgi:hypothetical protein